MDREELEAMLGAYLAAWRQGDAALCAAFYADDARMEDPLLLLSGRRSPRPKRHHAGKNVTTGHQPGATRVSGPGA